MNNPRMARVALAIPVLLLLAGCGATGAHSGNRTGATTAGGAVAADSGSARAPEPENQGLSSQDTVSGSAARPRAPVAPGPAIISTGQVSLHATDLARTRFELQRLVDGWSGTISSDESSADAHGTTRDERLVLRVPSARFEEAMTAVAGLGRLVDQSRTSRDVTTKVIDNLARVRAQRLSLARMEALLARAANLDEIIAIEGQLSTRQADLDSLESQQKYLADQTALATITVYLSVSGPPAGTPGRHGLLLGLDRGWDALGASTAAVLTAVGAVLPFSAVVALLGIPAWLLVRRRRRTPLGQH